MSQRSPFRNQSSLPESFAHVQRRIAEKIADYKAYQFSGNQSRAFNVFFDLAQEFDPVEDLLTLAVLILRSMCNTDAEVYMLTPDADLERYCCSTGPDCALPLLDTTILDLTDGPFFYEGCYCIPIRGKKAEKDLLPIPPIGETLGLLVLHPHRRISPKRKLFFEKFANRMGYQLHNRLLAFRHREHLRFIKSLVHDIGHNVIGPNMHFKLLFRQLGGKILGMRQELEELHARTEWTGELSRLDYLQRRMDEQYQEVYSHFQQTSLFLETLLRQSHFEKGRYVLHKTMVRLHERIILPQLERYLPRFEEKGIAVLPLPPAFLPTRAPEQHAAKADFPGSAMPETARPSQVPPLPATSSQGATPSSAPPASGGTPDQPPSPCQTALYAAADVGLTSQVLANLLSNAVKYTRSAPPESPARALKLPEKFFLWSATHLPDYFGPGRDAARVDMISSGPHIAEEDAPQLFHAEFRGQNVGREYGTGHGLFFAQEISRLHGGDAGYEPHPLGNCFYVILPCSENSDE